MNIPIASIRTDGGTQPRAAIDDRIVDEYRLDMMAGATFPPVTVFFDGTDYWLADGFHRIQAARQLGQAEIDADVHQGTRRDAILYSVGANAAHGVRRTDEDKRRAVMTLLNDPEWREWPIRKIARQCGVSEGFTHNLYHEYVSVHGEQIKPDVRTVERNGSTYAMNTANIGRNGDNPPEKVDLSNGYYVGRPGMLPVPTLYPVSEDYELEPGEQFVDPVTGEIFTDDDDDVVPFEPSPEPQNGQPVMPQKPTYHAGNRSVGDQFHSKLVWNYERLDLSVFDHFTIGYSQRSWEQFNELLAIAGVTVLMDVRRNAVSQYKPEFSKQSLQLACEAENLIYIHAPELGVDFEDRAELSETHDYNTLFDSYEQRLTPAGIWEAINRRIPIADQRVVFMCVEIDPCTCHRNRIAKALQEYKALTTFDL